MTSCGEKKYRTFSRKIYCVFVLLTATVMASCSTSQGNFALVPGHEPYDVVDREVEVFYDGQPSREYIVQARLDAHFEKTYLVGTTLASAVKVLLVQARRSGSDAIIDIEEKRSRVGETRIYHVTAKGIRYLD